MEKRKKKRREQSVATFEKIVKEIYVEKRKKKRRKL